MSDDWLVGEGEMAARIGAFDWSSTPLGPRAAWPQSLKTALDICLSSGFSAFLLWGPELTQLYNDAARAIARAKHPSMLGAPAAMAWREIWDEVGPLIDDVLATGGAVTRQDLPLRLDRGDWPETAYFTFAFSPLRNETGAIAGVMVVAIETTDRVTSQAGLSASKERLHQFARHQAMLLAELQHRTRNLLGVVRSVARRTAETSDDLESFLTHFDGRLSAIARTHTALSRNLEVSACLDALILEEFLAAAGADRVTLEGPEVQLSGKLAESMSLTVHELVTNALKYGALTTPKGHVHVSWTVFEREGRPLLALNWRETGVGVIDVQPSRMGFGRRLVEKALPYELGACTALRFAPGGVSVSIEAPLPEAGEKEMPHF
jgi:two-component sensor histidine kinase